MGGFGSGRRSGKSQRLRTADHPRLDLRLWKRGNYLLPGQEFGGPSAPPGLGCRLKVQTYQRHLVVIDPYAGHAGPRHTVVAIDRTECRFGGSRDWLLCPNANCGKRVVVLYFVKGRILCRTCGQLTYGSQYEVPRYRSLHRAQSIRMRLGGSPNLLTLFPWCPKGMRESRYRKLSAEALKAESQYWDSLCKRLSARGRP